MLSMVESDGYAIGIDLGTTNSCVAGIKNDQPFVIPNMEGYRTTPSALAFFQGDEIVGEEARKLTTSHAGRVIYGVKRLIGKWSDDRSVQTSMKSWSYRIASENNQPKIVVQEEDGIEIFYYPEEISKKIILNLKMSAEGHLGGPVTRAVVAVPAQFDDNQRFKTKEACEKAGLKVLALINEPTAAAIAFAVDKMTESMRTRTVVVYDIGGGTMDVSVLRAENGILELLATDGSNCLAGEDFNQNLYRYLSNKFQEEHETPITTNKAVARLRKACEDAKCSLSTLSKTKISLDGLLPGIDFELILTRDEFETLNEQLFRETISYVDAALRSAGVSKDQVDDVVLVGGSTRIPRVQQLLKEFFDGRDGLIKKSINPDEAVALGAAIRAGSLTKTGLQSLSFKLDVKELVGKPIGTDLHGIVMDFVFEKDTVIPASCSKSYRTVFGNQTSMDINIYQGPFNIVHRNTFLGKLSVDGIEPGPPGAESVTVQYQIDDNDGMLRIFAFDRKTPDKVRSIDLFRAKKLNDGGSLDGWSTVESLMQTHEESREQDKRDLKRALARNELSGLCRKIQYLLNDNDNIPEVNISSDEKTSLCKIIELSLSWCADWQNHGQEDFINHFILLDEAFAPVKDKNKALFKNLGWFGIY